MSFLLCLCLLFNKIGEKEQVLPGSEGEGEKEGAGAGVRNDPNNVCTCEYMNKEKEKNILERWQEEEVRGKTRTPYGKEGVG
jgi:hypothetical protein